MGIKEQAQRRFREIMGVKQDSIERKRGLLGDGSGVVRDPLRPDVCFIRINADPSKVWRVFNDQTGDIDNLPVIIEKQTDGQVWRVVEIDRHVLTQVLSGWGGETFDKTHSEEHEWPDNNPGRQPVNIFSRALEPLRTEAVIPAYDLNVYVRPYRYTYERQVVRFPGETVNLSSLIPDSGQRIAVSYLDVTINRAYIIGGPPTTYSVSSEPTSPTLPWFAKPSAEITLRQNQNSITESDIVSIDGIRETVGPRHNLQAESNPTGNDDYTQGYAPGSIWINRLTDAIYILVTVSLGNADWQPLVTGGSYPFNIVTVDPDDSNADYSDLQTAFDDLDFLVQGITVLFRGTHEITGSALSLQGTDMVLRGFGWNESVITSSIADATVSLSAWQSSLENCKVINTATSGSAAAVKLGSGNVTCRNVWGLYEGSGTNGYGIRESGSVFGAGRKIRIEDCRGEASGATDNYGLESTSIIGCQVDGGYFKGSTADILINSTTSMGMSIIRAPILENGLVTITNNDGFGNYLDTNGSLHSIGDAAIGDLDDDNLLANGSFLVWQRGTSFTGATTPANDDDTYLMDRWILLAELNDGVDISQQSSSPPEGARYFVRGDTQNANTQYGWVQILPANVSIALRDRVVSLSFQAKTTAATIGTVRAAVLEWTGTADSPTSDVVGAGFGGGGANPSLATNWAYANTPQDHDLSTSWQTFKDENILVGSSVNNLAVFIWVDDSVISVNDIWDLATVRLQLGSSATKYVPPKDDEEELRRCLPFFEAITPGSSQAMFSTGQAVGTADVVGAIRYVEKRVVPTITVSAAGHFDATNSGGSLIGGATSAVANNIGVRSAGFQLGGLSGLTAGHAANMFFINSSGYIWVDAEL